MSEAYDGREVVGMDLHRSRSVLVRMTADGRKLPSAGMPGAEANRPPGQHRQALRRASPAAPVISSQPATQPASHPPRCPERLTLG